MKTNWKTTAAGIIAIVMALCTAITAVIDNNPLTNIDIGATTAAVMAGVGLIFAKDAEKSA